MARIRLIIPCYNEALRLDVERFLAFELAGHELRLVFVDDGSTDRTLEVLRRLQAQRPEAVEVLALERNSGKAEAVRRGVLHALEQAPDYVGFWDADLATPLAELPAFCALLERRGDVDMVFGSRVKLLGRTIERHAWRHYIGRTLATAISWTLGLAVYDTQCGAKLFRASELLREVFAEPFASRWLFDVEILARAMGLYARSGISVANRVVELPLMEWRDVAGSKVRLSAGLKAFADLVHVRRTLVRPLRRSGALPVPARGRTPELEPPAVHWD